MNHLKKLLSQLPLKIQFLIIGAVFIAPLIITALELENTIDEIVEFSKKESQGIEVLAPYLTDVQQFAHLIAEGRNRNLAPGSVQEAFRFLGSPEKAESFLLEIRQATLEEKGADRINRIWKKISSLAVDVADHSNLTLDPDIDSYYIMDTVCTRLIPTVFLAIEAIEAGNDRVELTRIQALLEMLAGAIGGNFKRAHAFNPNLGLNKVSQEWEKHYAALQADITQAIEKSQKLNTAQLQDFLNFTQTLAQDLPAQLAGLLKARIQNKENDGRAEFLLAASLSILAGFIFFLTLSNTLNKVETACNSAAHIQNGQLSWQADEQGRDEISEIILSFNAMGKKLQAATQNIGIGIDSLNSQARNIQAEIQSVHTSSVEQRDEASNMAAASEEMLASIEEVTSSARTVTDVARSTEEVCRQGTSEVKDMISLLLSAADTLETSTKAVRELKAEVDNANGVIGTIHNIAEQTHLLALNASVEAARAGKYGKGFAVVANEVRNLAHEANQSVRQVSSILEKIHLSTENVSETVINSRELTQTTAHRSESTIQSLDSILSSMAHLNSEFKAINMAMEQQSTTCNTIAHGIEQLAGVAESNSIATENLNGTAEELKALALQLDRALNTLDSERKSAGAKEMILTRTPN